LTYPPTYSPVTSEKSGYFPGIRGYLCTTLKDAANRLSALDARYTPKDWQNHLTEILGFGTWAQFKDKLEAAADASFDIRELDRLTPVFLLFKGAAELSNYEKQILESLYINLAKFSGIKLSFIRRSCTPPKRTTADFSRNAVSRTARSEAASRSELERLFQLPEAAPAKSPTRGDGARYVSVTHKTRRIPLQTSF
jgi:hypothetical protein